MICNNHYLLIYLFLSLLQVKYKIASCYFALSEGKAALVEVLLHPFHLLYNSIFSSLFLKAHLCILQDLQSVLLLLHVCISHLMWMSTAHEEKSLYTGLFAFCSVGHSVLTWNFETDIKNDEFCVCMVSVFS